MQRRQKKKNKKKLCGAQTNSAEPIKTCWKIKHPTGTWFTLPWYALDCTSKSLKNTRLAGVLKPKLLMLEDVDYNIYSSQPKAWPLKYETVYLDWCTDDSNKTHVGQNRYRDDWSSPARRIPRDWNRPWRQPKRDDSCLTWTPAICGGLTEQCRATGTAPRAALRLGTFPSGLPTASGRVHWPRGSAAFLVCINWKKKHQNRSTQREKKGHTVTDILNFYTTFNIQCSPSLFPLTL